MNVRHEDVDAARRLVSVRPVWHGIRTASAAIGLESHTVLHCGPPASPPHGLVKPTLNSAAVACVYEGWASTLDEGLALVESGRVRFEPAQDRGVATPMAAVVSPSMALIEMVDQKDPELRAYAPVNGGETGGGPAPRYGRRTPEALEHLRFLNGEVAELLAAACAEPLEWLPVVDQALVNGDDTHLHHLSAHEQLVTHLRERLGPSFTGTRVEAFISRWPFFHLNFWMAAVRCVLSGAQGVPGSSLVTAFGGNGANFGLQVSGLPGRWFTVPGAPPRGNLREPHTQASCVGAYGDSAIIEAFGLGALAHRYCPAMQAFHQDFYYPDLLDLPAKILVTEHDGLPQSRARVGLSARVVADTETTPVVELGIVHQEGTDGGLGAGLYRPPIEPFMAACNALDSQSC